MKKEEITISGLIKIIESDKSKEVRLRSWYIARLFGVYESTINANVKAIIKSGVIIPNTYGSLVQSGKTFLSEFYDLEMIIILAFRINSAETAELRKWVMGKINKVNIVKIDYFQMKSCRSFRCRGKVVPQV